MGLFHRSLENRRKSSDVISVIFNPKIYIYIFLSGNTIDTTPGDHYFHYIFYHIYLAFCFFMPFTSYI